MTSMQTMNFGAQDRAPIPIPSNMKIGLGRKQLRMDGEFKDKVALITGAGAGIGRAIALRWTGTAAPRSSATSPAIGGGCRRRDFGIRRPRSRLY